jgi:hypothetical protein
MGVCEPGLAASACDCAAIEQDHAPINVAPSSKRWPRGQLILGFIHASMERTPSGFKVAILLANGRTASRATEAAAGQLFRVQKRVKLEI